MRSTTITNKLIMGVMLINVSALNDAFADDFPDPINSQASGEHPPAPGEMPGLFELPDGFRVTLFAGEPDVRQPIAFEFDDRGRIWVAENYTYNKQGNLDPDHRDRVIILHDQDGDGRHDSRKVFWDDGNMLTGLTWGFGGLWVLNDGTLSLIPDRNNDDIPDSEPIVMINGWTKTAAHNFVNGLLWGPDGWLYGRHGITDSSLPGTPDTPSKDRNPMNAGIWRFHPTRRIFEIVCHGTTNPWGLDYDKHGQLFMTNNVIAHLWHVIPGAHYERMYGQDFNPYLYELMGPCSDHYHWDDNVRWTESRDGKAKDFGGGHSHCGGMIYQGTNFPEEYRGKIFMCNTHGRCINIDRLQRDGGTYVASHEPDFLRVNTPWFRGVELKYGPGGCVFLSDWSDNGECHDRDGVHRTSGRIYRISYGSEAPIVPRVNVQNDDDLLETAITAGTNEWHRRRAARQIMERHAVGSLEGVRTTLTQRAVSSEGSDPGRRTRLNAAWLLLSLNSMSGNVIDANVGARLLGSPHEHIRGTAIRFITESPGLTEELGDSLFDMSRRDGSAFVQMCFAASLQRLPFESESALGPRIATALLGRSPDPKATESESQLRRMIWYGIESDCVKIASHTGLPLRGKIRDPILRTWILRRLASDWDRNRVLVANVLHRNSIDASVPSTDEQNNRLEEAKLILNAVLTGLRGQTHLKQPDNWESTVQQYQQFDDPQVSQMVGELAVLFGDGVALKELRELIANRNGDHTSRLRAIDALAADGDPEAVDVLLSALDDPGVYVRVAGALAGFDDPRVSQELIRRWERLRHGSREAATDTLCSHRSYALDFVRAIVDGRIDATLLTASQVRQLLSFGDSEIKEVLESHWGTLNESPESRTAAILKWKTLLTPQNLAAADTDSGASLFRKSCAACHKLYGEGGAIGPDLTGANRNNLDYVLKNIIDPGSVVPKQFTISVIALKSGRIITGVVVAETPNTVTVQTEKDKLVFGISDIEERVRTGRSLMPDGLLDSLNKEQVRDLIAFVMKRRG